MKRVYLDYAATSPLDGRALAAMMPYLTDEFGNADSVHSFGRRAADAVDTARRRIASAIGAARQEIYFTSGGTEANNWAVKGVAHALGRTGKKRVITTAIEHPSVLAAARSLERYGFDVAILPVSAGGVLGIETLRGALGADTALVSVMTANNEAGTVQPVRELAALAHEYGALFHTDAVQAAGHADVDVSASGVDLMTVSAHKFGGPKGAGFLYIKKGVLPDKLIEGGHQERSMRGGTTNVPGVVGLAEAFRLANEEMEQNNAHVAALRDRFIARVLREIPYVKLNGHPKNRLPNNANFSFRYIEGESLLFSLDLAGIAVSSGSACSSGSLEPSHVLLATGLPEGLAHGSIRFSFGKENTAEEVDFAVDKLKEIVVRLRALSPLFPKELKNEVYEKEI